MLGLWQYFVAPWRVDWGVKGYILFGQGGTATATATTDTKANTKANMVCFTVQLALWCVLFSHEVCIASFNHARELFGSIVLPQGLGLILDDREGPPRSKDRFLQHRLTFPMYLHVPNLMFLGLGKHLRRNEYAFSTGCYPSLPWGHAAINFSLTGGPWKCVPWGGLGGCVAFLCSVLTGCRQLILDLTAW